MENGDCLDEEGHNYEFIGYMVVAEKLSEEPSKETPIFHQEVVLPSSVGATTIRGTTLVPFRILEVPSQFAAKIEVWQCRKCGNIKLQPAVFTRILAGDKEEVKK